MLNKKLLYFLILFLLKFSFSFSQDTQEDEFLLKKLYKFTDSNNDSILFYANKLKGSKNLCNHFRAINFEAKAFYQKGELEIAEEKSLLILKELKNKNVHCFKLNKLTSLNRLFWIYKNQSKYQKAFETALERKKITESIIIKDAFYNLSILSVYQNLATIKNIMGFYEGSRKILKEAYPKLQKIYTNLSFQNHYKDPKQGEYFLKLNQSSILNLIGESYLKSNKNLDSASIYFKKAYEIAKQFKPLHRNSETLYQLKEAEVLIAKNKFKEALTLIQKFDINSSEFKTSQNINSLKAICFYQLNNVDSTFYYSRKFLSIYNKDSKERLVAIYDILANQFYKNKQIDSAYKYSELTISEVNTLNKSKTKVNKSYYLYDFRNAKELNKTILNSNNNKTYIICGIIIIILFSLFIISFYYRKNKKTTIKFDKVNDQLNNIPIIKKKEYNIDEKLEKEILSGITQLEKTKDFLDPEFNINTLAKKLNTNTTYLSYIINTSKNKSFKQYITQLKIEFLLQKLKEEKKYRKYTIKSLAEEIGYTNASAFTRAFKKYKGITPSVFIKSLEKN